MSKIFLISSILLITFTTSCGFKVVKKSDFNKFKIINVTSEGEKRINFKIKNILLAESQENQKNELTISLNTNKIKSVKEKNINNEITKYEIEININVGIQKLSGGEKNFIKSKSGDYSVENQNSNTINNEKKLIDLLADNLAQDILDEINLILDDL